MNMSVYIKIDNSLPILKSHIKLTNLELEGA